jgi:hypothetical protein
MTPSTIKKALFTTLNWMATSSKISNEACLSELAETGNYWTFFNIQWR